MHTQTPCEEYVTGVNGIEDVLLCVALTYMLVWCASHQMLWFLYVQSYLMRDVP